MRKLNSIERSKYINDRYKDYLRSSFKFGNGKLQKLFEDRLNSEVLFKGPYVDLNLPFQRGHCLNELMDEGVVCKSFSKLGDINFERSLYSHQEESIRRIGAGRSAIITTGTGSGKTESFLYPILNELMSDIEQGNREVGIRAIFLYPMNALVNDQIDRVRKILTQCPDITYGFFTGDTKESVAKNYRVKYGEENDTFIPDNELVSREEIRENPPHLLFTNYSMLEYLLIRPNDYAIFEPNILNNWKYVVLDEAHSYYGSLGIELSLLMRRLTGLAEKKPRFILTSATLGEQGKSEKEIVDFARSLTSATFEVEDIIFSKRILLQASSIQYRVDGTDYLQIKDNIDNLDTVNQLCTKYLKIPVTDIRTCLYELLARDGNVFRIYNFLKNESKNFNEIHKEVGDTLSTEQLIVLIDLINLAEKNGIGLFDLKYHSFVRPLSGAYITLGNEQRLGLTKTNMIEGLKAFEVGNCRYCSSPYIIGKIQHNEVDQLDYLFQNKEIDIYENYGNNEFVKLDYFLMENAVNEEKTDKSILKEFTVCSKCGAIHPAGNLNAKKCGCGDEFKFIIYRVVQSKDDEGETVFNNINQCPCCGHKGQSGVVKSLNLGKDEGTSLIAQILLEAIDEGELEIKQPGKLSLKMNTKKETVTKNAKVKQFLSFSDSRQQASFAAAFLDSNQVRLLQKRLIWEIIEEQNYRDIPIDELAAFLTSIIKTKDLFPNDLTTHKNAWIALLIDLLRIDGAYDGEGLGLYYFDLDLSDIMDNIDEEDVEEAFGKYNINKTELETIIQVVFGVFKLTPAINYVKSTLTPDEKMEYLEYRRFDNYVMFNSPKAIKNTRSFLPVNGKENMVVRYIERVCACDDTEAKDVLNIIFNNLAVESGLLKKHDTKDAYQIDVSQYCIKNYRRSKYYQCSKCGRLTPYNVHNVCVQDKCDGNLSEVDPDVAFATNYYREQYKHKKIESIVVKEHTAQLDRKTAKKYQLDFKNKKINILSCSTTFEMGIDIGDLETVFMRNVPPTPANYVQRAGRAGRRKESAAYILTYCGTGSHDFTYFMAPEKMISGVINPPYFNVLNKKIIVRHLMTTCLGFFFRQNPSYFNTINGLVFGDGVERFKEYVANHPEDLNCYINEKILPESVYAEYHNFKWFDEMNGNDEKMEHFVESIRDIAKEYEEAKKHALTEEKYQEADYYARQIEKLHKEKVIDSLSKYCVIPKYGFPVDVVELQIYKEGVLDNRYDLNRDLKIGLSEYAPDSEVIVDGKKYTSKYISLPKASQFPRHYFCTCPNCKKINVYVSTRTASKCKYCGESIVAERSEFFIEPINGFKTGVTKESTRMKPKRSYAGEVSYLGGGIKDENRLEIGKAFTIETSTDDELLVMNKSGFYMCPICGYSDIMKRKVITPELLKKHKNFRQFDCQNENLEQLKLGHRFQTDVARFTIPLLDSIDVTSYSRALSFMYAFLEGVSNALGIERNDIDGILELNLEEHSYDILLYDNVPGGAGHVKRLMNKAAIINSLRSAHNKVSQQCCDENTSCYNCLRNYYNQAHHSRLRRIYAKEVIEKILCEIGV
ncbi:DEAD/DEAH box helicase [Aminipila luticellarii]|uniref:DEAD/DEAH box helicase n=1 Tax=Aminipila luticellarii TaxID=2507160 RepID=UPI0013E8B924|nr:DEAD/DEAH box helicase [Aminipila luticellarii]